MNKKIRGLSVLLAVGLLVSVFSGCSSKQEASTTGDTAATTGKPAETTAAPAPAKAAEITYMLWGNQTEQEATQKVADQFTVINPDVKVKVVAVPYDQYVTKLNTLAASNSLPDTAIMMESQALKWAENGMLLDQGDMFTGDNAKFSALAFKNKEGKVVGYSCANEVLVLYYSKPLFDKAGLEYPPAAADKAWTWQQFVDTAKKLTLDKNGKGPTDAAFDKNNIVQYGAQIQTTTWMWPIFAISNGGGLVSKDGRELLLGKPESIEAAQAIADLNLKEHVAPSPAALKTFPSLDASLLSGKVAMAMDGQWNVGTTLGPALAKNLQYGIGVLPKFKEAVTYGTGGPFVIFTSTKAPDAAKKWIAYFGNEDNNMDLITSGIWMPTSEKWYKDEALIKKWTDNANHKAVPEYKTAVIDYALSSQVQVPWYYCPTYARMEEVLSGAMDPVWAGTKTAKDAIEKDILPKIQPIFDSGKAN